MTYPSCYLRPEIDAQLCDKLREIIKKHKGTLSNSQDDADHIIYPPIDEKKPSDTEWIRVVQKRGKDALIHTWYLPDSHDQWLQNVDIDEPEPNDNCGIWNVNANWILDTEKFNEWMNQEDYEVDYDNLDENNRAKHKKPPNMRKTLEEIMPKKKPKRSPSPTPPVNKKIKTG